MELKECYSLLDLRPDASLDDAKRAFRDLVKQWHPDKFLHSPVEQLAAHEKMKTINVAYEAVTTFIYETPDPFDRQKLLTHVVLPTVARQVTPRKMSPVFVTLFVLAVVGVLVFLGIDSFRSKTAHF